MINEGRKAEKEVSATIFSHSFWETLLLRVCLWVSTKMLSSETDIDELKILVLHLHNTNNVLSAHHFFADTARQDDKR
jgi:hypothetical protein